MKFSHLGYSNLIAKRKICLVEELKIVCKDLWLRETSSDSGFDPAIRILQIPVHTDLVKLIFTLQITRSVCLNRV